MAFDCSNNNNNQRKPLLFSDLFKSPRNISMDKEQQDAVTSKLEGTSCSSSSTQFSSYCDSSSSGFSTPMCSDLESEDGDFIAELTRQMAECMLQEEEETQESSPEKNSAGDCDAHSGEINRLKNGYCLSPVWVDDQMPPKTQVYELRNQPPVSKEGHFCRGRRVKGTESAQQKQSQKTEQNYMRYSNRGRERGFGAGRNGFSGSGMQAVFLGGSGPRTGSSGTGVFLPRDSTELKNKSGCSTVLIPTRVLQVLELHFSRSQDSTATPLGGGSPQDESTTSIGPRNGQPQLEARPADGDEMQLPQEWTY